MDFFCGLLRSHPVIWLMSRRTSSAVARNSGLLSVDCGTACAGRACWAFELGTEAGKERTSKHSRVMRVRKTIEKQDNREPTRGKRPPLTSRMRRSGLGEQRRFPVKL